MGKKETQSEGFFNGVLRNGLTLKQRRHRMTREMTYIVIVCFMRLALIIPHSLLRLSSRVITFFTMQTNKERRIIMANIEVAFPDMPRRERKKIMSESLYSNMLSFLEFIWVYHYPERIGKIASVDEDALKLLDELKEEGGMVICPHIGNWELGNLAINRTTKLRPVIRRFKHHKMNSLMRKLRNLTGAKVIEGKNGAKKIYYALKNKEFIMMLVDQNVKPKEGGFFVDFFGLPVPVSKAPAAFAFKTKSPMLIAYCIRENGKLNTYIERLKLQPEDAENSEELTKAFNKQSEDIIRKFPEQYLWMYERFRYIPPDYEGDRSKFPFYAKVMKNEDF
jgi:KDO2-lipid IV(A) lauroyltransferase